METFNKALPPEPTPVNPVASKPQKSDPITELMKLPMKIKILIGALGALVFIVLLILILSAQKKPAQTIILPSPVPTVSDAPSPVPQQISVFGQTPQFQQFESALGTLKKDITELDLNENQLAFPFLDMQFDQTKSRR